MNRRYLGWDTSSSTGIAVAFEISETNQFRILAEWSLSFETSRHSERLLWTIDTLLQSAGWNLRDLTGFVVGMGPGSFTGIRIGVTTVRMLAGQLKIPVYPVSSLMLLARGVAETNAIPADTLIIACTDATKGEWFTLCATQAELMRGTKHPIDENALTPQEVMALVQQKMQADGPAKANQWIAVGNSTVRYESEFAVLPQDRKWVLTHASVSSAVSSSIHQVKPSILAQLGYEAIQAGLAKESTEVYPHYLRVSEPEMKLKKGLLKPQRLHTS